MSVFLAAPGPISEYCRLCASRVSADRLLSFSSNDADSNSLFNAIRRLIPTITRGDGLPMSICSLCDTLLRSTTSFLEKVEYAQDLLSRIFSATESERIKLENAGTTPAITSEYLNASSISLHSSKRALEENQVLLNSWYPKRVSCQKDEIALKDDYPMQPLDKCPEKTNSDLFDSYADVEYPGTSIMIRNQFYEIKKEFVENIISGRPSDGSSKEPKGQKKYYSADSTSSEESSIFQDRSDGTNSFEPFPEFTGSQNEDTDALAISVDGNDTKLIDEFPSSALNLTQFTERTLKGETTEVFLSNARVEDEIIQPSVDNVDSIAHTTIGKTKARHSSNRKKTKVLSSSKRKSKSLSKNNKGKVKTSNSSSLPLYNDLPTAIDDLPMQYEDPTAQRWSDYYFCKRCDINFNTLQNLRQHWWTTHKRCVTFKCTMCTVYILNYKRFFRHLISHQNSLEKCCEFCNKRFVSAADARYHKKLDHPEENRPHQCGSCGTGFDSALDLQDHQDDYIVHQAKKAGDRRFKCKECGQEFLNKITLVTHMDVHDPTKNVCQFCNKSCTSKYSLKEHVFIVHEATLQFYCQICGKGFKRKSQLRVHLDAHNGVKRFSCCFCDKKFRDKSQLKSHQPTHSSVKPYVCEICDKSYKFKCGLKSHVRTHEEGYVPYTCDVCVKTFQNWSNYNKHMKRIHGKDMSKRKNIFKLSAQFLT